MICAYCGQECRPTKEHIISSGILDLFPECFMTIDDMRKKVYPADPMINDVCADCNNKKISYIDSYAKEFVKRYFMGKYGADEQLDVEYDYSIIQKMLLKYAYNDLRMRRENTDFFNAKIKSYLMNSHNKAPLSNVTVMAGLAVNTSPAPDFMFGNLKIQWSNTPMFLANSIIENIDYETGQMKIREPFEREKLPGLLLSYIFRFNSGQFILMCWDEHCADVRASQAIVKFQYPYTVLEPYEHTATLSRCTSESTYHHFQLIDVTWGQSLLDEISLMRRMANPKQDDYFNEMTSAWEIEEKKLAEQNKRD